MEHTASYIAALRGNLQTLGSGPARNVNNKSFDSHSRRLSSPETYPSLMLRHCSLLEPAARSVNCLLAPRRSDIAGRRRRKSSSVAIQGKCGMQPTCGLNATSSDGQFDPRSGQSYKPRNSLMTGPVCGVRPCQIVNDSSALYIMS